MSALPAAASTVQNVTAQMAGKMMEDGWVLLDVRPEEEVEKVAIEGAVTVPLFGEPGF